MAIPVGDDGHAPVLPLHDPARLAREIVDARLPADLPASGAWRPGDPAGDRQFLALPRERAFALEFGGVLHDVDLAYETWGELDDDATNAVLVCHALTGDAHAAGVADHGHGAVGWWDDFIGPGKALDTDRLFVVCVNVLGGCQGTTGPASIEPSTGRPYGSRFPVVSVRDVVRSQRRIADHLGIRRWHSVVGGSMGGMQALEWAVMYPERVNTAVVLASTTAASSQ
ncbi:MAG: alpha/beta fold hydrolase, partial [Acidimicrobiia bacterium]|nr:alpha/beta fold hydrolase [Acidimicrobiia bacterium]